MPVIETLEQRSPKQEAALYHMTTPGSHGVVRAMFRAAHGMSELIGRLNSPRTHLAKAVEGDEAAMATYESKRTIVLRYLPYCVQHECVRLLTRAFDSSLEDYGRSMKRCIGREALKRADPGMAVDKREVAKLTNGFIKEQKLSAVHIGALDLCIVDSITKGKKFQASLCQKVVERSGFGGVVTRDSTIPDALDLEMCQMEFSLTGVHSAKHVRPAAHRVLGLMIRSAMLEDYLKIQGIHVAPSDFQRHVAPERDGWAMLRCSDLRRIVALNSHIKSNYPDTNEYERALVIYRYGRTSDPVSAFESAQARLAQKYSAALDAGKKVQTKPTTPTQSPNTGAGKGDRRRELAEAISRTRDAAGITPQDIKLYARYLDNLSARRAIDLGVVIAMLRDTGHPAQVLMLLKRPTEAATNGKGAPEAHDQKQPAWMQLDTVPGARKERPVDRDGRKAVRDAQHSNGGVTLRGLEKILGDFGAVSDPLLSNEKVIFKRTAEGGSEFTGSISASYRAPRSPISNEDLIKLIEDLHIDLTAFARQLKDA